MTFKVVVTPTIPHQAKATVLLYLYLLGLMIIVRISYGYGYNCALGRVGTRTDPGDPTRR